VATVRTIIDDHLIEHADDLGEYLEGRLQELRSRHSSLITGQRGLGLMRAFDLADPKAQDIMDQAMERGLLVTNAGPSTIRFVPPLIIERSDVDEAMEKLDASLAAL